LSLFDARYAVTRKPFAWIDIGIKKKIRHDPMSVRKRSGCVSQDEEHHSADEIETSQEFKKNAGLQVILDAIVL
jgi:hypothetical protein